MKNNLRPYFRFTKKERTGIVLLVGICLFLLFLPFFFSEKELSVTDLSLSTGLVMLKEDSANSAAMEKTMIAKTETALFPFNPNTIDAAGWMRLGLDEKLTKRILNYRNKGGRFYQAADLKKIWGLPPDKAHQLIPYVVLPERELMKAPVKPVIAVIDINTANQEDWKALPGIGEALSTRIIKYRNQSGGFTRIEELGNVFGLTDSALILIKPYLRLNDATITKWALNRASVHQLIQKAGIPETLARTIVKKRLDDGNYQDWSEVAVLPGMNNSFLLWLQKAFQLP